MDILRVTSDGGLVGVSEATEASISSSGGLTIPPGSLPPGSGTAVISAIYVDCVVAIRMGNGPEIIELRGADFYWGCVTDFDEAGHVRLIDSQSTLTVTVDAWFAASVTPDAAKWNQQRLTRALRSWEGTAEAHIVEWQSAMYPEQISRYGFRP